VLALPFAASVALVGRQVAAQPASANVIQLGGGANYGVSMRAQKPNPWGLGLGLGVGYTLTSGLYTGARFEYFFGGEEESTTSSAQANIWDLFAEGGYDLGIGDGFVLRGKGDVGLANLSSKACVTSALTGTACTSDSKSALMLGPGAAFLYLSRSFSFTLDVRYDFVLTNPNQQGLIFTVGIGF
jgi:hypothetical protein